MYTRHSFNNISAGSMPVLLMILVMGVDVPCLRSDVPSTSDRSVFGVFVATSPAGESIRQLLQIPSNPEPEVIRWKLTLHQDEKTLAPTRYELRCDYGLTAPGEPGLAKVLNTVQRQGAWTKSKGSKPDSGAAVFELKGTLSLLQIDRNILHVLNPDRSLMIGNGGWSYSLNRDEQAEKRVDADAGTSEPDMSYQIAPLASGPKVFGVFEGRSPCKGIAGQLQIPVHPACQKAKWRVTLYQHPETLAPTTYRVEGTLYRRGAGQGNWTRIRGSQNNPQAIVYLLTPGDGSPALYLLKGDDNVVFFLNQNQQALVGDIYFSYTLNRRFSEAGSPCD